MLRKDIIQLCIDELKMDYEAFSTYYGTVEPVIFIDENQKCTEGYELDQEYRGLPGASNIHDEIINKITDEPYMTSDDLTAYINEKINEEIAHDTQDPFNALDGIEPYLLTSLKNVCDQRGSNDSNYTVEELVLEARKNYYEDEIMSHIEEDYLPYQELMQKQSELLQLDPFIIIPDNRVGAFSFALEKALNTTSVDEIASVVEGLTNEFSKAAEYDSQKQVISYELER